MDILQTDADYVTELGSASAAGLWYRTLVETVASLIYSALTARMLIVGPD